MGYFEEPQTWGASEAPPIFLKKVYQICNFFYYIWVHTPKVRLYDKFWTIPIFACGARDHFGSKSKDFIANIGKNAISFNFRKNDARTTKIAQNVSFDTWFPKITQKYLPGGSFVYFWISHCSIVSKQWETIENPQEQQNFKKNLVQSITTVISSLLTKFGVIITNIAHFVKDFRFSKYIANIQD